MQAALTVAPERLRPNLSRLASKALLERLPALRVTYSDGRRFRIPAGDAMYAEVFVRGAYEPKETAVVARLLRPDDFAVDIGANYGWYSILMAEVVGRGGRVWAIEPVPTMLAELDSNLALNPDLQIEIRPVAVGETAGSVELHVFEGLVHGHTSVSTLGREDYVTQTARMETLDSLLSDAPAPPSLVKMDVEGAERAVLAGSSATLDSADPPIWMVEVNAQTSHALGYCPSQLIADLRARGPHSLYRVSGQGLVLDDEPETAPHGTTWICAPPSRLERVEPLVMRRV